MGPTDKTMWSQSSAVPTVSSRRPLRRRFPNATQQGQGRDVPLAPEILGKILASEARRLVWFIEMNEDRETWQQRAGCRTQFEIEKFHKSRPHCLLNGWTGCRELDRSETVPRGSLQETPVVTPH